MVRVVLVQPFFHSIWDCLGLGYIGSYIKANYKGDLELDFYQCFFDSDDTVVKGCSDADIVGFSCTSPSFQHGVELSRKIKQVNPDVWTVFGGWHVSALSLQSVRLPEVDQVIVGEGERSFLSAVRGNRDKVIWSQPIQDLDSLPWPDRELIKVERTIALTEKNDNERITSVQSSRGCPYRCNFCANHIINGRVPRRRSVTNVADEIQLIVQKYALDLVKFCDAELNTSVHWLKEFSKELTKRKLDVEFEANVHASNVDLEMFQLMKKAGFRQVDIGVETGSERILKQIGKGITVKHVLRAFHLSKQAGLKRRAYLMCGFPTEDFDDIAKTFMLAEKIEADLYGMTVLAPFPGCALYDHDKFGDVDWSRQDEYFNDFWQTDNFTPEDLKWIQQKFVERFKDKLVFRLREESQS